ncbi:MAG: cell envelope integrity protein TolA, partial [Magnetococcales bacterium]|nr:cell envelope integrity protein TolA [Magnetococcales bacterium]
AARKEKEEAARKEKEEAARKEKEAAAKKAKAEAAKKAKEEAERKEKELAAQKLAAEKAAESAKKASETPDFSSIAAAIAKSQPNKPAPRPATQPAQQARPAPAQQAETTQEPRASSLTVQLWQRKIHGKVFENWTKPSGLPNELNLAVTVLVEVGQDGTLVNPRISRTSGNAIFDRSVIRAIQKTASVEQAPAGCPECRELEINFRPQ